jgi:glycerol kinase
MRREAETLYCLEGMVITAGAVFDWLADGLGILDSPADSARLAETVADTQGVFVLPALQGVGSPHADYSRHALVGGLTRGATRAHVVRAAMEGLAFRTREILDAVYADPALPRPNALRVDGGASANDVLMQIQANALGQPVERMAPLEATAYGAALLAGQATGLWDNDAPERLRQVDRVFEPQWTEDERNERFSAWQRACGLAD